MLLGAEHMRSDPTTRAGSPLRERERGSLSDKDLEAVVDDSTENGLSSWGCPAKLFKYHRRRASVQRL